MNLSKAELFTDIEVHHVFLNPYDERLYTFNSYHDKEMLKHLNWVEFKEFRKPVKGKTSVNEKLFVLGALICVIGLFYFI